MCAVAPYVEVKWLAFAGCQTTKMGCLCIGVPVAALMRITQIILKHEYDVGWIGFLSFDWIDCSKTQGQDEDENWSRQFHKKDTLNFSVFVFSMPDTRLQSIAAAMYHTTHSHCVFHNRCQPNDPLGYHLDRQTLVVMIPGNRNVPTEEGRSFH